MEKTELISFALRGGESLKKYICYLNKIDAQNPFVRPELVMNDSENGKTPYCLIQLIEGIPKILMPIHLRPIGTLNRVDYFDVISPYGYSGPALSDGVDEALLKNFWKEVDQWYFQENVVSEFIRFSLNGNHLGYNGEIVHTLNNVKGKIDDRDSLWTSFKPKVRNNYRKAVQNDLTFKLFHKDISREHIQAFHSIYTSTMVRNAAKELYFFGIEYFENFIHQNPDKCLLTFVYKNDVPISTEFILIYGDTLYSFLGGTLSDYFYARPNDFLKINVMKWGGENSKKYYTLGGGRIDGDGLYAYKKSFFPKEEDVVYYTGRKVINPEVYNTFIKINNPSISQDDIIEIDLNGFFPKYREHIRHDNF